MDQEEIPQEIPPIPRLNSFYLSASLYIVVQAILFMGINFCFCGDYKGDAVLLIVTAKIRIDFHK